MTARKRNEMQESEQIKQMRNSRSDMNEDITKELNIITKNQTEILKIKTFSQ